MNLTGKKLRALVNEPQCIFRVTEGDIVEVDKLRHGDCYNLTGEHEGYVINEYEIGKSWEIVEELTSLPEKWCIKHGSPETSEWFTKNGACPPYEEKELSGNYAHYPSYNNCTTKTTIASGYTEITFDQFKRWVLKEEEEFKVGDWVVRTQDGSSADRVTKGKCYQLKGISRDIVTITDNRGVSDIFEKRYFRKALPHEIPNNDKESSPDFQAGKWYKSYQGSDLYYLKIKEMSDNKVYAICQFNATSIEKGNDGYGEHPYSPFDDYPVTKYSYTEAPLSEIQQYLPDNHVDKVKKFQVQKGKVYWSNCKGFKDKGYIYQINRVDKTFFHVDYLMDIEMEMFEKSTGMNDSHHDSIREATTEEKQWLEACIQADKFIPKNPAKPTKEDLLTEAKKRYPIGTVYRPAGESGDHSTHRINGVVFDWWKGGYRGEGEAIHEIDSMGLVYNEYGWAEIVSKPTGLTSTELGYLDGITSGWSGTLKIDSGSTTLTRTMDVAEAEELYGISLQPSSSEYVKPIVTVKTELLEPEKTIYF